MRYAIVIPDGAADHPRPELGGRTPLEAAELPFLAELARSGSVLAAHTVPTGLPPGSDVANLSVLGYDPARCYTGRAPLEAAAMGLSLAPGQAVFRANTVTVRNGVMEEYAAGHISTEEARELILFLDERLGLPGVRLHPGVQYRHACVIDGAAGRVGEATPPHDILGQPIEPHLPVGGVSELLRRIMARSAELLANHPVNRARLASGRAPATQLWLWGGGVMPTLESYQNLYGLTGGIISAVDLLRGIGRLAGLEVISVPGATGYYDTDYAGKGAAALACLRRHPFVAVHVEAPDEAGHNADTAEKVKALERIDRHILRPLYEESRRTGDLRLLVLPDHPTPIELRTHTAEPVPAVLWGPDVPAVGPDAATERELGKAQAAPGHTLLRRLIDAPGGC